MRLAYKGGLVAWRARSSAPATLPTYISRVTRVLLWLQAKTAADLRAQRPAIAGQPALPGRSWPANRGVYAKHR